MRLNLPVGPEHAPPSGLFNEGERKRFISMTVLMVTVVGMLLYGWLQGAEKREARRAIDEQESALAEVEIVTPKVDRELLAALTRDSTPEHRVLIETPALEELLKTARMVSPGHFEPMGGVELTPRVAESLLADPAAHRGELVRAYGEIEAIAPFDASGKTSAHYRGRLKLEGGGTAWFAVLSLPDDWGQVGHFVRIDGLFLKVYRELAGSEWVDAPLLVSRRAERAYPRMGQVTRLDPIMFQDVEDDSAEGITGQPFEPFWLLVSYAMGLPEEAVDWDAAPLLDRETVAQIYEDGDAFRGKPFRIPSCELLAIWHQAQPENPARIDRMVEGWAANWDWVKGRVPVIRFAAPLDTTELRRNDYMTARGFFLKNLSYEPRDGGVAVAPYFVLHSLESHTPVKAGNPMTVVFGAIAVGILLLVVAVYLSLIRDRRKATELQSELRRRRQARRQQPQSAAESAAQKS